MRLAVRTASFRLRNLSTRLPFRYGVVTRFPLLHLALEVETAAGRCLTGCAADRLPPTWFNKDPANTFRDSVDPDLASMIPLERWSVESLEVGP